MGSWIANCHTAKLMVDIGPHGYIHVVVAHGLAAIIIVHNLAVACFDGAVVLMPTK